MPLLPPLMLLKSTELRADDPREYQSDPEVTLHMLLSRDTMEAENGPGLASAGGSGPEVEDRIA